MLLRSYKLRRAGDYLNPAVATTEPATAYKVHTINETYVVSLTVEDFQIEVLSQDILDFGTLDNTATSDTRQETPSF